MCGESEGQWQCLHLHCYAAAVVTVHRVIHAPGGGEVCVFQWCI